MTQSRTMARRTSVTRRQRTSPVQLSGEALISFISGTQTNIGKQTFYNLADEQQNALAGQHTPVLEQARPFYTLMALPQGVNDVNKQLIAYNLIQNSVRESELKPHERSQMTMWENEILLQAFCNMQPNRVMDFIVNLRRKRVTRDRAMELIYQWLKKNEGRLELWAIKYRKDMKSILKHARHNSRKIFKHPKITQIWKYLRHDKSDGFSGPIRHYVDVQKGDQKKLGKLPSSVAEGFKQKFGLTDEEFWKLFKKEGGRFTAKERRQKDATLKRSGESTGLDIRKLQLFDLLVYLNSQKRSPMPKAQVEALVDEKAKVIASKMLFKLDKVGLVLDTSLSMAGTKEQPFHPLLRGVAISRVIKQLSAEFKEYRTNDSTGLIPKLKDQSNYADAVVKAIDDGCNTIVIVGDGYENAPYEGALHQLLYIYKKKVDKDNKLMVFHFNPVFASEAMDVRLISDLAPQIGVREVEAMNESMFLAIAKQKPMYAIQGYIKHLAKLQSPRAKELMPTEVKKVINARNTFKVLEGGN